MPNKPPQAFRFQECILMVRPLGIRAYTLREFLAALKTVEVDSLHHHFHQASLKHQFDIPDFPNDFAQWATSNLQDATLAEKLGNLNPYTFKDLEALRESMVEIVEDHLMQAPFTQSLRPGQEFNFSSDTLLVVDTGHTASTLKEFHQCLNEVDESSFYFHFYESRFRLKSADKDDFSYWFETNGYPGLARKIQSMEIYFTTLRELRQTLLAVVGEALDQGDPA